MRITIDVKREGGQVTRLVGVSGMAVVTGASVGGRITPETDTPVVTLRCNNAAELAWNLAALMGAVRSVDETAFAAAFRLMELLNFDRPVIRRELP